MKFLDGTFPLNQSFYTPSWRGKPTDGAKQGSDDFISLDNEVQQNYNNALKLCMYTYNELLRSG